jgi:hypothetical protein
LILCVAYLRPVRRSQALLRGLQINFSVCDMRAVHDPHGRQFDILISENNAVTHLLNHDNLFRARRQRYDCIRRGGGCLVSGDPGAADWTVVLRGTGGSEIPASNLPPESWLSPYRQMGPGEVA